MSHYHRLRARTPNLSSQRQNQGATPMAVDTTAIVTGAPSRNVPKTIEGQWQAVKPPWGRHKDTEPDNLSVPSVLNNKPNITTLPTVSPTTPSLCPTLLQQLTPSP